MKLLDIIALVISLLSVAVSIVALIACVRKEKKEEALLKNSENEYKDSREQLPLDLAHNYMNLKREFFDRYYLYAYSEFRNWNATAHHRINENADENANNNAQDPYHQMLIAYLKTLYPEADEELILLMSAEFEKHHQNDFKQDLSEIGEKYKKRMAALGKGISDQ